jgi:hypothetical protein
LLKLAACRLTQTCTPARFGRPALRADFLTMCQTAFSEICSPLTCPDRSTFLNMHPSLIWAAVIQQSSCTRTQSGIGTVRMCRPFPTRSTIAQRPSRCSRSRNRSETASCLRSPQASRSASRALSRLPFNLSESGASHSALLSSADSQLPRRTPIFLNPRTRRMPAARSALRSPQSAASYASLRTAPSRRLIVPGARRLDSRWLR